MEVNADDESDSVLMSPKYYLLYCKGQRKNKICILFWLLFLILLVATVALLDLLDLKLFTALSSLGIPNANTAIGPYICQSLTSVKPSWTVVHCEESAYTGHFILTSTSSSGRDTRFRGRIVGSAIQGIDFKKMDRNNDATFVAKYNLPPGAYSVHVDLRYDDFDINSYYNSTIYSINPVFQFNFTLPSKVCKRDISHIDGYWTTFNGNHPVIPPHFLLGAQPNLTMLSEELRFILVDCALADDAFLRRMAMKHRMAIFGDSQNRHLTTSLVELIDDTSFKYLNITQRTDKTIHSDEFVTFIYDPFAHCFLGEHNDYNETCPHTFSNITRECDILLLNFGQWQIGWPSNPPWNITHYLDKVHTVMARANAMFPSKRIVWLTIHPHGEIYEYHKNEFRNDIVLKEYNNAAVELCRRYGYEYVDVFRHANALHDLTYDGAHYKIPVEREIVRILLHSLFA